MLTNFVDSSFKENVVSVQSINGYSAREEISDRHFDNMEWRIVESDFKQMEKGGLVSFELRLSVKKRSLLEVIE